MSTNEKPNPERIKNFIKAIHAAANFLTPADLRAILSITVFRNPVECIHIGGLAKSLEFFAGIDPDFSIVDRDCDEYPYAVEAQFDGTTILTLLDDQRLRSLFPDHAKELLPHRTTLISTSN